MTTHEREPVDCGLLTDTIRTFGMAIEYRGQVFNPMDVVVHTNGMTDIRRISLVWSVVNRWSRPDCAPTEPEAEQLLNEIREVLAVAPEPVDVPGIAVPPMVNVMGVRLPPGISMMGPSCSCPPCTTAEFRTADEMCPDPACPWGKDPNCAVHGAREGQ